MDSFLPTTSGFNGSSQNRNNKAHSAPQSQVMGSSELQKEIMESTQAIMFDDFEDKIKSNDMHNSTFRPRPDDTSKNVVLVAGMSIFL